MSRPDDLKTNGRSFATAWATFIKDFGKKPSILYCFYEGLDDPKYYNFRIKSIIFENFDCDFIYYRCDGKRNVIQLFNLISHDERYKKALTAYFIDKDFDDIKDLPDDNRVFITPCYAIENLYVKQSLIEQILEDEFQIKKDDIDFQNTIRLFNLRLKELCDLLEELNSWLFINRKNEAANIITKININDISCEKLFSIKIDRIVKNYSLESLRKEFPEVPTVCIEDLEAQIIKFRETNRAFSFRGKYFIYFMRKFLMILVEDRRRKKNRLHFQQHSPVKLQLSDNILSELTQYADTPQELVDFLKSYKYLMTTKI